MTPDAVVQVTDSYGVVAEAKKNFASKKKAKVFEQLVKYDDDLIGWWTKDERISSYDIALLIHQFSSVDATDAVEDWLASGHEFRNSWAVVEFGLVPTGQVWLHLRRVAGYLSDSEHDEELRRGKKLGKNVLYPIIAKYKFTEDEPPLIHMMHLLHDYIFPLYPKEETIDLASGAKRQAIRVTLDELRDRMEEQFCEPPGTDKRRFKLPRKAWVSTAMDAFRRINLAAEVGTKPTTYLVVVHRPRKKDTIEYLTERLLKAEFRGKEEKESAQVDLFSCPVAYWRRARKH